MGHLYLLDYHMIVRKHKRKCYLCQKYMLYVGEKATLNKDMCGEEKNPTARERSTSSSRFEPARRATQKQSH